MSSFFSKAMLASRTYSRAFAGIRRESDRRALETCRERKLRLLIEYAYESIPFYRELFHEARIKPADIRSTTDLCRIPVLEKDMVRQRYWDFFPDEISASRVNRTSGSTGMPLCILSDESSRENNSAAVIRARRAVGIPLVGTQILSPLRTLGQRSKASHWTFLQGLHRTSYVNPYIDDDEIIQNGIDVLESLSRHAVIGLTSAVLALALRIQNGVFPRITPVAVMTMGEGLQEGTREVLKAVFQCPVSDIYACNEAGDMAFQCAVQKGYHINIDNVVLEVEKNGKPAEYGEAGEVIITNLNRFAMPFIRYRTGDSAVLAGEPCPCGSKLPLLQQIVGRVSNDLKVPGGKVIPWKEIRDAMVLPGICRYQVRQDRQGNLRVRIQEVSNRSSPEIHRTLLSRFERIFDDSVQIDFESVEDIPLAPSGKTHYVVSEYAG